MRYLVLLIILFFTNAFAIEHNPPNFCPVPESSTQIGPREEFIDCAEFPAGSTILSEEDQGDLSAVYQTAISQDEISQMVNNTGWQSAIEDVRRQLLKVNFARFNRLREDYKRMGQTIPAISSNTVTACRNSSYGNEFITDRDAAQGEIDATSVDDSLRRQDAIATLTDTFVANKLQRYGRELRDELQRLRDATVSSTINTTPGPIQTWDVPTGSMAQNFDTDPNYARERISMIERTLSRVHFRYNQVLRSNPLLVDASYDFTHTSPLIFEQFLDSDGTFNDTDDLRDDIRSDLDDRVQSVLLGEGSSYPVVSGGNPFTPDSLWETPLVLDTQEYSGNPTSYNLQMNQVTPQLNNGVAFVDPAHFDNEFELLVSDMHANATELINPTNPGGFIENPVGAREEAMNERSGEAALGPLRERSRLLMDQINASRAAQLARVEEGIKEMCKNNAEDLLLQPALFEEGARLALQNRLDGGEVSEDILNQQFYGPLCEQYDDIYRRTNRNQRVMAVGGAAMFAGAIVLRFVPHPYAQVASRTMTAVGVTMTAFQVADTYQAYQRHEQYSALFDLKVLKLNELKASLTELRRSNNALAIELISACFDIGDIADLANASFDALYARLTPEAVAHLSARRLQNMRRAADAALGASDNAAARIPFYDAVEGWDVTRPARDNPEVLRIAGLGPDARRAEIVRNYPNIDPDVAMDAHRLYPCDVYDCTREQLQLKLDYMRTRGVDRTTAYDLMRRGYTGYSSVPSAAPVNAVALEAQRRLANDMLQSDVEFVSPLSGRVMNGRIIQVDGDVARIQYPFGGSGRVRIEDVPVGRVNPINVTELDTPMVLRLSNGETTIGNLETINWADDTYMVSRRTADGREVTETFTGARQRLNLDQSVTGQTQRVGDQIQVARSNGQIQSAQIQDIDWENDVYLVSFTDANGQTALKRVAGARADLIGNTDGYSTAARQLRSGTGGASSAVVQAQPASFSQELVLGEVASFRRQVGGNFRSRTGGLSEGDFFQKSFTHPNGNQMNFVHDVSDIRFAREQGRIFDNVPVSDLPPGGYTYVITETGEISFGRVDDGIEFGSKHYHIAQGRPVVVAGELNVLADGSVQYNLLSGSYTMRILEGMGDISNPTPAMRSYHQAMDELAENVLSSGVTPGRSVSSVTTELLSSDAPNTQSLYGICGYLSGLASAAQVYRFQLLQQSGVCP